MGKLEKSYEERAAKFQKGRDSMKMTPFESLLAEHEKQERKNARVKYVNGIQGVDGGECVDGTPPRGFM